MSKGREIHTQTTYTHKRERRREKKRDGKDDIIWFPREERYIHTHTKEGKERERKRVEERKRVKQDGGRIMREKEENNKKREKQ